MGYRVKGTLKLPDGSPASNAEIEFISRKNFSPLVQELKSNMLCGPTGDYDVTLELGEYAVLVYPGGTYPAALGTIILAADTVAGQDLPTLLQQAGWQPATPEYIQQISQWLAEANNSATNSSASASAAKASETNAKASELAAESDRAEVAANSVSVDAKHSEVVSKAAIVDTKTAQVIAAESVAVAAADTASQKAADAATHEASSLDAATRAENAALSMVGAIIDGGECDLSGGVYPQPISASGITYSTVWFVAVGGLVSGIAYDVGDQLRYTTANSGYYFRVDAKDEVYSVNGEKGAVTVTPEKIGAEVSGTSLQLIAQHEAKPRAHKISSVDGLQELLDSKYSENNKPTAEDIGADPVGAAQNQLIQHSAMVGAHPASGISGLAELIDSISAPIGCSEWDRLRSSVRAGHAPADGQVLNRADHPDMWAEIADGKVPVVPDSDWLADPHKRGCFTDGDGSTTFRIPDQNGKYAGSIGALYVRGDGVNSAVICGMIQGDVMRNIAGVIDPVIVNAAWLPMTKSPVSPGPFKPSGPVDNTFFPNPNTYTTRSGGAGITFDASLVVPTGPEFRPASLTGCWVVKVMKSSKVAGL